MIQEKKFRVMIVEDHPVVREGLHMIVSSQADMQVVAHASSFEDALRRFQEFRPDVTMMDLVGPEKDNVEAIIALRNMSFSAKVVVFSASEGDGSILRALNAGAASYLFKSTSREGILNVIRQVLTKGRYILPEIASTIAEHFGRDPLTAREIAVLRLVREGQRNKQIADYLAVAETTVNFHIKNVLEKLRANDRTHAVTIAIRRGFLSIAN